MNDIIHTISEDALIEQPFIGCCLYDPKWIDLAVERGLKPGAIHDFTRREIWLAMLRLRTVNEPTDLTSLVINSHWSAKNKANLLQESMLCAQTISNAELHGKSVIEKLLWRWKMDQLIPTLLGIKDKIAGGADKDEIIRDIEVLPSMMADHFSKSRGIKEICDEAEEWAKRQIAGTESNVVEITTGIPKFDRFATHIQPHEYVVVCARTSLGKTSFMEGIASNSLRRGLKVVYFTIESSDRSVVQQICSQVAKVNLRFLRGETYEKQKAYYDALAELRNKSLFVFDRETSLSQIQAKCRMLVSSVKPDVVFLDYINIIRNGDGDAYQRVSNLSEEMIGLRKMLGCTLIVGAQLNRGNEKDERRPERTDLRDSGSLEEDAHRIIALHRPVKDLNGMEQGLERAVYDYELLQLKLRDGPCFACNVKFSAPYTAFYEEAKSEVTA